MSDFLQSALGAVSGAEFQETPMPIERFVTEELEHPPLSEIQYDIVRASTQIYREDTLKALYGRDIGAEMHKKWTKTEVICCLGKGSGKDSMAKISCLYVVYLLLCLKSPQEYFGIPRKDYIDIMNIAINSDQAQRVFFGPLAEMVKGCSWFDGKYDSRLREIEFDKNVRLTSGHSESESLEGYNVIMVILDEISGFALESNTGNAKAKTGPAIYKMHRGSVNSRFPNVGKVILLSFPRFENDFISQRYNKVIAEKEIVTQRKTLKLDPDLPDGYTGNEFEVEWDRDYISRYARKGMWAINRPTWEVNPLRSIEDFTDDFYEDMGDALTRFAAMPTASRDDAYFKNHERIEETFCLTNGVDEEGVFWDKFVPHANTKYYMHVDLAQKHDRCVVAMGHVENWKHVSIGSGVYDEYHPEIVIDAIRWWQPSKSNSIDFQVVIDYILSVRRRGFNIELVTFDRWQSHDTRNNLEQQGIKTDNLSVGNDHYQDFKVIMYDQRLHGPNITELHTELKELMWIKGKVDHPRSGFKDLCDGSVGAVYNAVSHTKRPQTNIVDIKTAEELRQKADEEAEQNKKFEQSVIQAPKKPMPARLRARLTGGAF